MNISIAKIRRSQHLAKAGCKPFEHWKQPMNHLWKMQTYKSIVTRQIHTAL
ncbi:hypothetical protein QSI_1963 [Clostridioides difficile P28]|nr:hypothetical protein QSI_1963 [Clostridioides difficile P28]